MRLRLLSVLASLLALAVSASFAYFVHENHLREADERMQVVGQRIEQRMAAHILTLQAIKGAFTASRSIPGRQFLRDVIAAFPEQGGAGGAQGYGFAKAVATEAPEPATRRILRDYDQPRELWPATDQPIRFPIVLLEPQDGRNRRALGYDMYAEPTRREAMENAARSALPAISAPVELVQENAGEVRQRGFLLYVPLFGREGVPTAGEHGTNDVVGFVYAPFRASDLIQRVLTADPPLPMQVEVYSGAIAPQNVLHFNPAARAAPTTMTIDVADRKWVLLISDLDGRGRLNPAYVVMLIGLVLAGIVGALVDTHVRSVEATERLAQERKDHIEQRELMLGEMQHRIKNSIARMLAMFRLTARETEDKTGLVKVFDQRLQAMARAQSLIVSGASDMRTLGEVVAGEIGQWETSGACIMPGPEVRLDLPQVQAIGLILHELSTNALKYGALATGRPLTVSWRREGESIVLDWQEDLDGSPAEPVKAGSGFGSRFMRMMVEGQLGGSYQRELTEHRFAMTIRFPAKPDLA